MSDDSWVSESTPYVRPRTPGSPNAWTEEAAGRGHKGGQKTLEVATIAPSEVVRTALRLEAEAQVVVRRRLILLDEQPVELTDSYYPAEIASGTRLADPRKIPGGAVALLAELGFTGHNTTETVNAAVVTESEARLLGLHAGSAVLKLVRVTVTADEVPFEVSIMTMPPERHLTYRTRRTDT